MALFGFNYLSFHPIFVKPIAPCVYNRYDCEHFQFRSTRNTPETDKTSPWIFLNTLWSITRTALNSDLLWSHFTFTFVSDCLNSFIHRSFNEIKKRTQTSWQRRGFVCILNLLCSFYMKKISTQFRGIMYYISTPFHRIPRFWFVSYFTADLTRLLFFLTKDTSYQLFEPKPLFIALD